MASLPTPIRIALGLAATAVDEARRLPEKLPQLPVTAVSTAMQASLRVQQRLAELTARGDEVLTRLQGTSDDPPAWATFDDDSDPSGRATETAARPGRAAFELVDETELVAPELLADSGPELERPVPPPAKAAKKAAAKKAPAKKAPAKKAVKTAPAKKPAKKATKHAEPLEVAAQRAEGADEPTPSTVAAEIVQAQEQPVPPSGSAG